jgi:hypothetical protein
MHLVAFIKDRKALWVISTAVVATTIYFTITHVPIENIPLVCLLLAIFCLGMVAPVRRHCKLFRK